MTSDIPIENVEPDFFELEITSLEPSAPPRERRVKTVKGLDRALSSSRTASQLVIGLTCLGS